MENRMNYTKGLFFLLSGIVALVVSVFLGSESDVYGFLVGYGYTALAGGLLGILYTYFKNTEAGKQRKTK